jgi:hypothetical protein
MSLARAESKWETVGTGSLSTLSVGAPTDAFASHLLRLPVKSGSEEAADRAWPHDDSVVLAFHRDRYENRRIAKGRHDMGSNPVNLAVRFLLEIAGLAALGWWGWSQGDGILRFVLALGIPILAAVLWGTFAVPDDPSRSGKAPVPVPGIVRLVLELAFFAAATWALFATGLTTLAWIYGVVVLIHYAVSYDRILWLVRQ